VKRSCSVLFVLLLTFGLGSCGYGLIGRTSNVPEDIQSIYIQPLENRTTRERVELFLTQAIVDELVTRRRFTVVSSAAAADAILKGALTAYIVRPVAFGSDGRATDYEITVRADMEFKRQGGEEILWAQDQYVFRNDYPLVLDDPQGAVIDLEDPTVQAVAEQFAQTLVIDLLEGF
jgi:outer membrane lipopolysaccharide assembly protein LptE/RlpB